MCFYWLSLLKWVLGINSLSIIFGEDNWFGPRMASWNGLSTKHQCTTTYHISSHFCRHDPWKEWLHIMVSTPRTDSSILSRQRTQSGSSVQPGIGRRPASLSDRSPGSWRDGRASTDATKARWQISSWVNELYKRKTCVYVHCIHSGVCVSMFYICKSYTINTWEYVQSVHLFIHAVNQLVLIPYFTHRQQQTYPIRNKPCILIRYIVETVIKIHSRLFVGEC